MFNNKKKNIKDLDNVFQTLEKKEDIIETEEERAEKLKNKREIKKIRNILIIILIISSLLIVLSIVYAIYENITGPYANLKAKNRQELIIRNVDETLLTNYLEKDKYTFVIFWASWCSHCQNEASTLNKFMLGNKDVNFIVVSHDTSIDTLTKYFETHANYNWFVILDSNKSIRNYVDSSAASVPRAYLLDSTGNVVDKIVGEATYDELLNLYNSAINK